MSVVRRRTERADAARAGPADYAGRVIVVCGNPGPAGSGDSLAVEIARRAAIGDGARRRVQVIAVMPDDPGGDRRLQQLTEAGVGHVAVLRGPARPLDAADIDLALRYLAEMRVVIGVELEQPAAAALADAATFAGATPILVTTLGAAPNSVPEAMAMRDSLPATAIVLAAPARDPDGTFAGFVAALAGRLDAGETPADAWAATTAALAVDAV